MRQTLTLLVALTVLAARPGLAEPLPALSADTARMTVSGLSSGAYMAGQFQVAYSRLVTGAGLVAGGPYACAFTPGGEVNPFWPAVLAWNVNRAQNKCMEDGWFFSRVPSADELLERARELADDGGIDPLENLREDKVYLFTSEEDDTVESGVVARAEDFYRAAGIPSSEIRFIQHERAAHAFLTTDQGLACGETGSPYINDCDYDQAGAILEWLIGPLKPAGKPAASRFIRFDQAPFTDSLGDAGLGAQGIVYIPESCRSQAGCKVHVVFHGCKQGLEAIGDRFVKASGYAGWAEANRLIVLFPQAVSSTVNPKGCWDWWGYTGRNFLEKSAPQMQAVKGMLDRLSERP